MAERQELGREKPLEVAAEAHVEHLFAHALERPLAERERLLAHAADHGGELPELRVGGEPPAELDLPARRRASTCAEAGAPGARLLARLPELARDAGGCRRECRPGACRHLAEPLRHVLRFLPEPGRRHLGRPLDLLARLCRLLGVSQLVERLEIRRAATNLFFLAVEIPEIEQIAARQQAFLAEERQHLFADQHRAEPGPDLVELRLLPQMLEQRMVAERVEQRPVEHARARHVLWPSPARFELEEEAEDVLDERVEMGDEPAAGLDQGGERRRIGSERREGAPVVRVALDPAVLARRDEDGPRRRLRAAAGRHQSRASISCWICTISCFSASTRSTGRPPLRACARMASTLPRMFRILVCASTAARVRSSPESHSRNASSRSSRDWKSRTWTSSS